MKKTTHITEIKKLAKLIVAYILMLQLVSQARGQNLFQNPGFEENSSCPDNLSQIDRAYPWQKAIEFPTPDYYSCGYEIDKPMEPSEGSGCVGIYGVLEHPYCSYELYSELIEAPLVEPLFSGLEYTVAFDLTLNVLSGLSKWPNECMDFGFYFYDSKTSSPILEKCICNNIPQISINANDVPFNKYERYSGTFVASANYDRVIVGAFPNSNTSSRNCRFRQHDQYFNLDNLVLTSDCHFIKKINLGKDTTICDDSYIRLDASFQGASYLWQDSSSSPVMDAREEGFYSAQITKGTCESRDTIQIKTYDCEVILDMPNVFTPNQDGYNDFFSPSISQNIREAKLSVYNKWGTLVHASSGSEFAWDGKNDNDKFVSDGVYYWLVEYQDNWDNTFRQKGFVTILK